MGLLLFLLFIGLPLIEIALFIQIGGLIGTGTTIAIVIVTALLGSALLRWQGLKTLSDARVSLAENRLPVDSVVHGFFLVIAGAFLITPGFLTDALGFLLFVPPVRLALGRAILTYIMNHGTVTVSVNGETYQNKRGGRRPSQPGPSQPGTSQPGSGGGRVIDGEAEEIDEEER